MNVGGGGRGSSRAYQETDFPTSASPFPSSYSSSSGASSQPSSSSSNPSPISSLQSSSDSAVSSTKRLRSFKTVLLGDASVGKSSLVLRFVKNVFSDTTETTIGAAFFTQTLSVDEKTVKFEIWDTAGQERFMSLAPMYYRGASAAIVVYDITNSASFERAQMWVQQLQLSGNPNIVIALVANKKDLIGAKRVPSAEAQRYAETHGLLFVETSAKTGQNVVQLFTMLARSLPETPFSVERQSNIETITLTSGAGGGGKIREEGGRKAWCCGSG